MKKEKEQDISEQEYLRTYDITAFERPSVTTDVVALSVQELESGNYRHPTEPKMSVLLIRRNGHPFKGMWALPGGFFRKGETVEECAARELVEETGLKGQVLVPVGTFTKPGRDPRGWIISTAFLAIVAKSASAVRGGDDAAEAKWIAVEDVLKERLPLAFDHLEIVKAAIARLRPADRDDMGFAFLPREFTLAELQYVYEFMEGRALLGPNFRRKMMPRLVSVGAVERGEAGHRPAALFKRKPSSRR